MNALEQCRQQDPKSNTEPEHISIVIDDVIKVFDELTGELCFSFNMKSVLIENRHLIEAVKEFTEKCKKSRGK